MQKKSEIKDKTLLLSEIRLELKNEPLIKDKLKEYKENPKILDGIPLDFKEMDVTAKTINGAIFLNPKVVKMEFSILMRYVVHEFVHVLQHIYEQKMNINSDDKDEEYLDREDELEAFKTQVKYDAKNRGADAAEEYVDELLDYHDISGKAAKTKKKELMGDL